MNPAVTLVLAALACAADKPDDDSANQPTTAVRAWTAPACPTLQGTEVMGNVTDKRITEASGLVASHTYDGVLWTHNDSGDGNRLYAIDQTGALLNAWTVADGQADDLEDIAIGQMSGEWWLFLADFGDNSKRRKYVVVTASAEFDPAVADPGVTMHRRMQLMYPDGAHNAETLLFDPLTEDLLIITKALSGPIGIYRKAAPHMTGSETTLEKVGELDFRTKPLKGSFPTAGDVHVSGEWVTLRNYGGTYWVWPRDPSKPLWEAFENAPCGYPVPREPQGEAIAFGANGLELWTLSEGTKQPLYRTTLTP